MAVTDVRYTWTFPGATKVEMITTRWVLSALLLGATPAAASAQSENDPGRSPHTGARIGLGLSWVQSDLGGNSAVVFESVGPVGGAEALGFSVEYEWRSYGLEVGLEGFSPEIGERSGSALSLSVMGNWRPMRPVLKRWWPVLGVGYVRQALGGIDMGPGEFPNQVVGGSEPSPYRTENVTLLGNGARLALGLERGITRWLDLDLGVSADLVSFGSVGADGVEITLRDPGTSFFGRIVVGVGWRPF